MKKHLAIAIIFSLFAGFAFAQNPDGILVITAERLPSIISQTAASVTVLEKEDLAGDITSALRCVVGTGVKQSGGTASVATLSIRNSSASQVLVLVDGLPLTGAQMPDQDFSIIPMEQVERIEILKGPASSLYGANAVGGVVNIITRKIEKPSTTVELAANSFKTYRGNFLHESWGEKFDWAIAGSASKGQDHRPDTEFQKGNLWAKIQMPLADMILTGTVNHYQDDKNIPTPPYPPATAWGRANQKDREERLTLNLKADAFTANILYRDYWQEYEDDWSLSEHKNQGFYVDGQYALTLLELPFLVGGDLAFDIVKSTDLGTEERQLLRGGIFLQQKSQLDLGLMRTNLRYDYHPSFGSYLSPSWNFLMPIDEQISSWIGIARAFRAPSMNDLFWSDPFMQGNPELKPETATNGELGVRLMQKTLTFELVAFARKVEDLIGWVPTGGEWDPWIVDNHGSHLFYGLEATGNFKIAKGLSASCGYTFAEGKNLLDKTPTPYTPKHTATCSLLFTSGILSGQLDGQFQSEQLIPRIPSRAVVSCQLSYPMGQGKIALRLHNLTNAKYEEQAGYHMPPRHLSLSFSQNF